MKFSEFNLDKKILKGTDEAGFVDCLEVQAVTIPHVLNGKDVLVQSQTGTGKTAAFLVPLFQRIMTSTTKGKALIVAPTRELAVQIEKEASMLGKHTGLKFGCFYGGVGYSAQEKLVSDGIDIIIGTPGRLIDLNNRRTLPFKDVAFVVIDEADRLFDMGFMPDLRKILKKLKPKSERTTMLFSATLSFQVKSLARDYMNEPVEIEVNPEQMTVDKINQVLYHVGKKEKIYLLLGLLKRENPKNGIIFVNTKRGAYEIASRLMHNGYKCEYLMGDLDQKKRLKILDDFKAEKVPFLVATDVASRGLHVEGLELVVNYDLPNDTESYVHRIGRTARVGKSGKAITFACEEFVYSLSAIEDFIKMKIPVIWADEGLYAEDSSEGLHFRLSRDGTPIKKGREGRGTRDRKDSRETRDRKDPRSSRERKDPRESRERKDPREAREGRKPADRIKKLPEEEMVKSARPEKSRDPRPDRKRNQSPGNDRARHKESARTEKSPAVKKEWKEREHHHDRKSGSKKPEHKKKGRSLDERLEYYKSKYGDNFKPTDELIQEEKKRKENSSIVRKILGLFSKKK